MPDRKRNPVEGNIKTPSTGFDEILDRLKRATSSTSDAGFAKILGIERQNIFTNRAKGSIPPVWVLTIGERFNVSLDWLIYGIGSMRRTEVASGVHRQTLLEMITGRNDLESPIDTVPGSFSERLLWLIAEQAKGKPAVFARRAGIPPSLIHHYVEGGRAAQEHIIGIRDTYGVNLDWLLNGRGSPYLTNTEMEVARQSDFVYNLPEPDSTELDRTPPPGVEEVLDMARKVLISNNHQAADALKRNIRYFAHAVEVEKRLTSVEKRLRAVEETLEKKES